MVIVAASVAWAAPELELLPEQRAALERGEAVWGLQDRRAWGAKVVAAPIDAVWRPIEDCAAYVDTFPYVTASAEDGVGCGVALTTRGITTRYELRAERFDGWMSFDAAPAGKGPLHGAHGWWRVEPWEGDPDRTLVSYTLSVDPNWWVPDWVGGIAARRAIPLVLEAVDRRVARLALTAAR